MRSASRCALLAGAGIAMWASCAIAQPRPWMNPALSPDQRAAMLEPELTLDERIGLVHGPMALPIMGFKVPPGALVGAGYIPGAPRLGVPALQETNAGLGVSNLLNLRPGDVATALPSGPAIAASFDPENAYAGGAMVGHEAWSKGFNVLLGGGADLIRDPRNGRNFEYYSEDPLLTGVMAGEAIRGVQDQHVVSTVKHFAIADQETGRKSLSVHLDEAAARESDLLAFEIAIEHGRPGAVMCSYNRIDSVYACENDRLLNGLLKGDWAYPGWVMSDWGATHGVGAANAGLDQESGDQRDPQVFFGAPLKAAIQSGVVAPSRLADMDRRILRSMFAVGLFDTPPVKTPIDYAADTLVAKRAAQEGIVLLANRGALLPLARTARSILVIGGHADAGVLSGGGSSQVTPVGGAARVVPMGGDGLAGLVANMVFDGPSPLSTLRAKAPNAKVTFLNGAYPKAAADAARQADIAIVFANQWMGEGADAPDLSLPNGQEALIAAVTRANPHTIVVLETGGPVRMPWLNQAGAVLEAWYPGSGGAQAIADVLFGDVDATGRLPMTFPASQAQLPAPKMAGLGLPEDEAFDMTYPEGADAGYRWYAAKGRKPLFPFGFGLSYTQFSYGALKVEGGLALKVSFDVTNTGRRPGGDTPQVYLTGRNGRSLMRLIGWSRVSLQPGETRHVTVKADPRLLADFSEAAHRWRVDAGTYRIAIGASSDAPKLVGAVSMVAADLKP